VGQDKERTGDEVLASRLSQYLVLSVLLRLSLGIV
jgi:hypothetical protein